MFDSFYVVVRLRLRDSARFIKFLLVGGTGFLVQLIMQEGAVRIGTTHPVGVAIGAESAIISNFLFNNFWTFKATDKSNTNGNFFVRLIKFNVTSLASIVIQFFADYFAEMFFGPKIQLLSYTLPTRIVILIPTIIFLVIPLNYIIYSKIIWKTNKVKK